MIKVFEMSQYSKDVKFLLPTSNEYGDYFTFSEIYQTNHGYNSYGVNKHFLVTKTALGPGGDYDCVMTACINADANSIVRWVEGFETVESRTDIGKNERQLNTILMEEYLPIKDAVKRMEDRSGATVQLSLKSKIAALVKLQMEITELENKLGAKYD